MDDVLVYTVALHDQRLEEVLWVIEAAGLKLNKKCNFKQIKIHFLGHIIDEAGVRPDTG